MIGGATHANEEWKERKNKRENDEMKKVIRGVGVGTRWSSHYFSCPKSVAAVIIIVLENILPLVTLLLTELLGDRWKPKKKKNNKIYYTTEPEPGRNKTKSPCVATAFEPELFFPSTCLMYSL